MGHFGRQPIQRAWLFIVFPMLLLNYFGQGALLIRNPAALDNPFFRLAPDWLLVPMLFLAAAATIIASQAVISGAFSIASQAVQLGFIPRLRIKHTSDEEMGQVYISKINILLYVGVIGLILGFQSSERLASAYGISVTGAMAVDTLLAGYLMIYMRGWNKLVFLPLFGLFLLIDLTFLGANLFKFFEGGWLPVAVATVALLVMISWVSGRDRLLNARWSSAVPIEDFLARIKAAPPYRIPGTAIFMVPHQGIAPRSLEHNLKHNKVLHERVVLMSIESVHTPYVAEKDRFEVKHLECDVHSVRARYGYMEEPNVMRAVAMMRAGDFHHLHLAEISFFVGKEKVLAKKSSGILTTAFIFMHRTMQSATEFYRIPFDHAIEIGGHVEI